MSTFSNHALKALVVCPDVSSFIQAQALRNVIDIIGTISTPEELFDRSDDIDFNVIFFIGHESEDWQDVLMEVRENNANRLLGIYALDSELNLNKKAWAEDSYLDDYLVWPKDRERLNQHLNTLASLQSRYGVVLQQEAKQQQEEDLKTAMKNLEAVFILLTLLQKKNTYF